MRGYKASVEQWDPLESQEEGRERDSCLGNLAVRNGQGKHRGQLVASQTAFRSLKNKLLTSQCLGVDRTSVLGYEVRSRLPA